jgi:hypothetical protein
MFAPAWGLWLLMQKDRWKLLPSLLAGYAPWIIVVGFGWAHLLGGLVGHVAATADAANAQGSLESALRRFTGAFRVPGTRELLVRLISASKLWLWAAPLMILLAACGFWRHRANTHMRLLLASAVVTFIAYLFVPLDQGHGWGYRYFHSAWFVLPVFAGAMLAPRRALSTEAESSWSRPLIQWTLAASIGGLLIITPYYAWAAHTFISQHLAQLPQANHGEARVVIIDPTYGYYNADLTQNDPFLGKGPIRMFSRGRVEDAQMMAAHFPGFVILSNDARGTVWGEPR